MPPATRINPFRPVNPETGGAALIKPPAPQAKLTRSALTDLFPTFAHSVHGGFTSINIPDQTFATLTAGFSAWFPLIDIGIDALNQEMVLFGWECNQVSCEYNAVAPNQIWGNVRGEGAAIVLGDGRLPIPPGVSGWVQAPCTIPGIETTAGSVLSQSQHSQYIDYCQFPPGSYQDAIPFKWIRPKTFAPWVWRFPYGSRLQVALVVRGSQIQNVSGVAHTLRGTVTVQLHVGKATTTTGMTRG